jgi:hypothetical protein
MVSHDFTTLYRKFNRSCGVDIRQKPEQNLHKWLDPSSPHYKPQLAQCVYHYAARTNREDRLKLCISTADMDDAAWKYGHSNQIVMDGTFGIVSSKLLLFVILGIDEQHRGVPLTFLLFSAPSGNRATHAGYNAEILTELLQAWVKHLSLTDSRTFTPLVAITDLDVKERIALLNVWPGIWLLLCKFHLRQCWQNKRKAVLKGDNFWKYHLETQLRLMEQR